MPSAASQRPRSVDGSLCVLIKNWCVDAAFERVADLHSSSYGQDTALERSHFMFQHARDALVAPNRTDASTSRCCPHVQRPELIQHVSCCFLLRRFTCPILSSPSSFLHFFSSAPVTSHHATTPLCTALQHGPRPRSREYVLNIRLVLFLGKCIFRG